MKNQTTKVDNIWIINMLIYAALIILGVAVGEYAASSRSFFAAIIFVIIFILGLTQRYWGRRILGKLMKKSVINDDKNDRLDIG